MALVVMMRGLRNIVPYTVGSPYRISTCFGSGKGIARKPATTGFFLDPQNFPQNHFSATEGSMGGRAQ